MSGIFRGSDEELVERTLAAERQIEIVDAELAALQAERRSLADQLDWERRPRLVPERFVHRSVSCFCSSSAASSADGGPSDSVARYGPRSPRW